MLVCATCGSRWNGDVRLATALPSAVCPMCEGALVAVDEPPFDGPEPVHADVARTLREHLLGVGA